MARPTQRINVHINELYNSIEEVERIPGPKGTVFEFNPQSKLEYLKQILKIFDVKPWLILTFIGILTAITGSLIQYSSKKLWNRKNLT